MSTRDGSPHIYAANADGSAVTRLTSGERPAWSWDGQRIAFHRVSTEAGDAWGIYVMNADGSNLRWLAHGGNPAWSPDGTSIVFNTIDGPDAGIFAINAAGGGDPRRLIGSEFVQPYDWVGLPTWSPDGRSIAFVRGNFEEPWQIYIMDADGSEPRRLIKGDFFPTQSEPAWSPDGSMIAFGSYFGIGAVNVDGSGLRDYTQGTPIGPAPPHELNYFFNPDWSPDGRSILFSKFSGPATDESPLGSRMRIFAVSGENGSVRQLIPEAAAPALPSYWDYDAAWSRVADSPWDYDATWSRVSE